MKRLFSYFLTLLALFALAAPASADVMWEPSGNSFYDRHQDQCEYENRSYYANGAEGFVTLWDAPNGSAVRAQFENGEKLRVYFIYEDSWALCAFWTDGRETSGWTPMSSLELVYDYICFAEEYADRITAYNGEFADYSGDAEAVNFFEYPGAPSVNTSWETGGEWHVLDNLTGTADSPSYISSIFVDENGRTWGYVSYMYGHLNSWFCLDEPDLGEPDGADFPVREVAAPSLTPAQEPTLPAAGYVPYILVAAVAAVTAGLLAFFYGKRRKSAAKKKNQKGPRD